MWAEAKAPVANGSQKGEYRLDMTPLATHQTLGWAQPKCHSLCVKVSDKDERILSSNLEVQGV